MFSNVTLIEPFSRDTFVYALHFPLEVGEFLMKCSDGLFIESFGIGHWGEGTGRRERLDYEIDA